MRVESNNIALKFSDLKDSFKKQEKENKKIVDNLKEDVSHQNSELSAVNSLIEKAEDEYIAWGKKIENSKKEVEIEKRKIQTVKDAFEKWKLNQLEQVAKLKLKGKIETIDKAGLGDIIK